MKKKILLFILSAFIIFPYTVSADDLNQIEVKVDNQNDSNSGNVGSLLSITSDKYLFLKLKTIIQILVLLTLYKKHSLDLLLLLTVYLKVHLKLEQR